MRTRQGETFDWGFGFALPQLISRPQGGVWGGMRADFGLGVFGNSAATKSETIHRKNLRFLLCLFCEQRK